MSGPGPIPCPSCGAECKPGGADPSCTDCGRRLELLGHRLVGLLGRGARSTVYEALSAEGEARALKLLPLGRAESWREAELFETGTRVLQGLRHPSVAYVHAFGTTDEEELVCVTELFRGGSMADRVDSGWHARPHEIRGLLQHLLELADHLHSAQPPILHRDIKPDNLMYRGPDEQLPVLIDFDVVARPAEDRSGLTIVGTPGYAAPEQFAGEATNRSDLYGIGATVLYAATHVSPDRIPRKGGRLQLDGRLDSLDEGTRRVLLSLLQARPEDRPASARAALAALSAPPPQARPSGSRSTVILAASVALLVAGAGAGFGLLSASTEAPPAAPVPHAPARTELIAPPPKALPPAPAPQPVAPPAPKAAETPPQPPQITIVSVPEGASVWHGDRLLGEAPLTFERPDSGLILVTLEGFSTSEIELSRVPPGSFTSKTTLAPWDLELEGSRNSRPPAQIPSVLSLAQPRFIGCGRLLTEAAGSEPVELKVRFGVRRRGTVSRPKVRSPPAGAREAAECVKEILAELTFPAGPTTTVNTSVRIR